MLNHALAKSMLFLLSGSIAMKYQTTEIHKVRGLLKAAPLTGFVFLCGILALIGMPPFGLFASEFLIFRAGFEAHSAAFSVMGISLVVLVFAGMLGSVNQMAYGLPAEDLKAGDPLRWFLTPMALNMVLLIGLGLFLPDGMRAFFVQVLKVLGVPS
jgi:hydrogenase-4 component F